MSLDIKGQKCAVCGEEFTEADDVVFCPICGAPHHRECYASLGQCGLASEHGKVSEAEKESPLQAEEHEEENAPEKSEESAKPEEDEPENSAEDGKEAGLC